MGRALGDGLDLGVGVGRGVAVGVAVTVGVGVGEIVAVGVAVGVACVARCAVGVGVASDVKGACDINSNGRPVLKKPMFAVLVAGAARSNRTGNYKACPTEQRWRSGFAQKFRSSTRQSSEQAEAHSK